LIDGAKQTIFSVFDAFYFCKGKNATQTRKKICAVYGEDAVSEGVCQN